MAPDGSRVESRQKEKEVKLEGAEKYGDGSRAEPKINLVACICRGALPYLTLCMMHNA